MEASTSDNKDPSWNLCSFKLLSDGVPDCDYGENGVFIYADCGLNSDPTAEQLASIAISAAETARILADMEPRVAMLSSLQKVVLVRISR